MKQYLLIFLILPLEQFMFATEPIALISKFRGTVKHKMVSDIKYQFKTQLNTPIVSDNQIRTKKRAFSKIVYLDDGTSISMYPETEMIIKGFINDRIIIKQVDLLNGIIMVNVANQTLREFKLTTPFSELTCQECSFWVISNESDGDQFIQERGDAQVWNSSINRKRELVFDSTLVSQEEVEFDQFKTPIKDVKFIESLMLDADEFFLQNKKENPEEKTSETITNILVIKLKNAANVEREIVVTYVQ